MWEKATARSGRGRATEANAMLRQMRYFIAVVDTGSFSEAAEVCHISQSAISQQIKALEDELDTQLLERHGRRFEVTPAGRWFCQRARRQVTEMDSIVREVRRIGRGEHLQLRVGVLAGFSGRIMRGAVHDFATTHPNVRLTLMSGTHEALFQRVLDGRLDLVVNDQRRMLSDHFVNEALGEQPLFAMLRQDAPQLRGGAAAIEDLKDLMCVVVSDPDQRENEAAFWRDVMAFQGDILFVDSVEDACLNAVAGTGWFPCDRDMDAAAGAALVPLTRGGVPLSRRMFAFWPEARDSALQWEFSETLARRFV